MKKLYPLLSVLFFIYWGCENLIPKPETKLTVTFVDDCNGKMIEDIVNVKISKIGFGFVGQIGVKVGNEKGMTVFLESGQYNLECRGKSKGLFTPSNNWKKTITIEPNQEFHQKFSCLKQYD